MAEIDGLAFELGVGRDRFLALVADVRPDLHRYCARMTGSTSEGEDLVQETLARAYYALPEMQNLPPLRSWLFQIAHRRLLDYLRRYDRRVGRPLDDVVDTLADVGPPPEDTIAHEDAVRAAIKVFLDLPPLARSCVILKDVLGSSADEIASLLDQSPMTVKAALHRGRLRLRALRKAEPNPPAPVLPVPTTIARYAGLLNERDWEGVRALLAQEVRLDLVSRSQRSGRLAVGAYLANYDHFDEWYLVPARLDGVVVVGAFRREIVVGAPRHELEGKPSYYIELGIANGLIATIRDFRYVPYICVDAAIDTWDRPTGASFAKRRCV
jgi:RNA polymerase sigma factor (sigma-70 family)